MGDTFGEAPFNPNFRVHPSDGVILETRINYFLGGRELPGGTSPSLAGGGDEVLPDGSIKGGGLQFGDPGSYIAVVTRTGISNTGITTLEKRFGFRVTATPPPPTPPSIKVGRSGPADKMVFLVTGTGFLPDQPVSPQGITVRAVDGVNNQDFAMMFIGSNRDGEIRLETDPLDTRRLKRNSLGQAKISFSAADKRKNPNSVPANEPLWSNVISFDF